MKVWLIIANPYAYDQAMEKAIAETEQLQTQLQVVFFICRNSMGEMMHDLGEMGWLGAGSLRSLQNSMIEGYRSLADEVLERVERKADSVDLRIKGVVEKPSLEQYVHQILAKETAKIIIAGSKALMPKLETFPDTVEYWEEE